jgi:hypothetical protein
MTRAFRQYPICWGQLDQSGLGSRHDTTQARATLQLAVRELQYVLQHMVINKNIVSKKLVLVFSLHFSVALAQNTTGITTATTMAAAGGNGPLVPHMRPCAPRRSFKWMGDNSPSLQMYFGGRLRVFMALKALLCSGDDALPQHRSVLRAIHTLNSCKNYIHLLGGLLPIHSTHLHGAQGLMWGTREPFLPAEAIVGYGCVGQCLMVREVSSRFTSTYSTKRTKDRPTPPILASSKRKEISGFPK